jgi:hypothetical protein
MPLPPLPSAPKEQRARPSAEQNLTQTGKGKSTKSGPENLQEGDKHKQEDTQWGPCKKQILELPNVWVTRSTCIDIFRVLDHRRFPCARVQSQIACGESGALIPVHMCT